MLRIAFTIFVLASSTVAQESFKYRCPIGDAVLPASCLELLKVGNVDRQLNTTERHQLAYLFAKAYVVSKLKYEQDYNLDPDAPISRLTVANFPSLKDTRREGGLWLGDLFRFFRSQPLYKREVEKSLRGLSLKQRKHLGQ